MYPTLETLDMTPEQLAAAREAICRLRIRTGSMLDNPAARTLNAG